MYAPLPILLNFASSIRMHKVIPKLTRSEAPMHLVSCRRGWQYKPPNTPARRATAQMGLHTANQSTLTGSSSFSPTNDSTSSAAADAFDALRYVSVCLAVVSARKHRT